jgi:hypothetical protein
MLINQLHAEYRGKINFLYMPIDFSTECNVGYSFINFRDHETADDFKGKYGGTHTKKCLPGYNSNKIAEVSYAAVQGLQANLDRLKRSPLLPMLKANEGWQPVMFDESGNLIPFPCEADRPPKYKGGNQGKGASPDANGPQQQKTPGTMAPTGTGSSAGSSSTTYAESSPYTNSNGGSPEPAENKRESGAQMIPDGLMIQSPPGSPGGPNQWTASQDLATMSPSISQECSPTNSQSNLDRVSHLVRKAETSPTQKKISDNLRASVTRKQIESFFDPNASEKVPQEDKVRLRTAMDHEGWIPINSLMSVKNMYYPGHDLMRECIKESTILEVHESEDKFRCADGSVRIEWMNKWSK